MINKERTRRMTRLAIYESGRGKKELQITRYFPGQYIKTQMFWSFVCGTIAFLIIFALGALYNVESLMMDLFTMNILKFVRNILLGYVAFMCVYLGICYTYLNYRYDKYKKRVSKYLNELKELYRYYVETDRQNL
jgi:hypothetical protein